MESITLGDIVGTISAITVIGAFFIAIFKFYKNNFTNKFNCIEERLLKLEADTERQDKEIAESKEERLLLIKSQLACLKGLQEQGCDGAVKDGISSIENYLINKAH